MRINVFTSLLTVGFGFGWAVAASELSALTAEQIDFFEKKVRPVLVENCYECHSVQNNKSKGGLALDTREGLLKGGGGGPVIVPHDPDKSLIIKAILRTDEELQMPPKHKLPDEKIQDLIAWVRMGAPDPRGTEAPAEPASDPKDFWSFKKVVKVSPPSVAKTDWPLTEIDFFILQTLENKGLTPAPATDKTTWLRRVTFDLAGFPPAPSEIDDFLDDDSAEAHAKVVDRLLASPAYGERWGRYWLDVVRYADTAGDSSDYPVPQAYRYRDYVIESFNQDKPFDQFIAEQIAGDLLPHKDRQERYKNLIATGYIANSRRFGVNPENVQHLTIEDSIDNLGKAFLGLTVSCARCHDHKYDPLTMEDYYGLYGIFSSTKYPFAGSENEKRQRGLVPLLPEDQVNEIFKAHNEKVGPIEDKIKELEAEIVELRRKEREKSPESEKDAPVNTRTPRAVREEIRALRRDIEKLTAKAPRVERAYAVTDGEGKDVRIHTRGEPRKPGKVAPRKFIEVLGGYPVPPEVKGSGRLELAKWIASTNNPLTARVLVNRVWQFHFGNGLVTTPNDFGIRGKAPSHPELLDYLAARLMEENWSLKSMHRLMVLSQTYRQSSANPSDWSIPDPNNAYLWKFNRKRLDAEALRDSLLFVSGRLENEKPRPHPFPPEDKWGYTQHNPFNAVYESSYRSVYLMQQRIKKHPYLELFDGADPNSSTAVRTINITPLQALFMMNDKFAHAQSQVFAKRVIESSTDEEERITYAHRVAFGRPPKESELGQMRNYLAAYRASIAGNCTNEELEQKPWESAARVLFSSNEFCFID
ncbi:MAG: DUF1553 domain-containing protein [Verrucomicrobiales bacterium]